MSKTENFWVVGIGASAGGLEALQSFVEHLDPQVPAAFVIAQHLSPHTKSLLVELLGRRASLPVQMAVSGQMIEPGKIYVVPPNHDIGVEEGRLKLTLLGKEHRPKPSVDHFFESLSQSWGERAVGIVLSGTGTDGAQGVRFIRAAGGLTFAQDDQTARYDGMPKSAVETGSVDLILAPDEMARQLENFLLIHSSQVDQEVSPTDQQVLDSILKLVKEATGSDFTQYKISTIRRRVEKQMRSHGFQSLEEFYKHLKDNPQSCQALAQDALISVTAFFRDTDAFEGLTHCLEKRLTSKFSEPEFRVWVAGCATGEEAYTVVMILNELIERLGKKVGIKVFATDLDQEALLKARAGFYRPEEIQSVPKHLLDKYFQARGEGFEVRKPFREMIVFARQDLIQSPPFVKVDLITCRNVLIYFEPTLQKKVFEIFHYSLNQSGILFLGKAESIQDVLLFEVVDRKLKIYKRLNVLPKFNSYQYRPTGPGDAAFPRKAPPVLPIEELIQKEILAKYELAGAVIDEQFNIVHIVGKTSAYLSLPEGHAHLNLITCLHGNAGSELPLLTRKVRGDGRPHRSRIFPVERKDEKFSFAMDVRPLSGDKSRTLFLVFFEKEKQAEAPVYRAPVEDDSSTSVRVFEMEQELASTKEHLQTVIEELGVSNEELQSLNEELSSTNEELQASNEQLETTNEELQSTNEELQTLNDELVNKSAELKAANLTLENIQNSIGSPMVVVDSDMRIVRFNDEISRIFDLSLRDLGKDITRISAHCEIPDFHENLLKTLETGKPIEITVESHTLLYQLRMFPFFDERKKIIGAILVFFDNTTLMRTEERLRTSEGRTRSILESSPNLIWTKDSLGRYLTANEAFREFFDLKLQDIIGKTDRDLFGPELASQLRDGDLEVFYKRVPIRKEETIRLQPDSAPQVLLLSRFPLLDVDHKNPYAVGTVAVDVTKQIQVQQALVESESRYKGIVEDQAVFVARLNPQHRITFVNKAFCNYFGGFADVYLNQSLLMLVDEQDQPHVQDQLERLTQQSPIVQFEHRLQRFGDAVRWIRWIVRATFNSDGTAHEYQAVGLDVTENRRETDRLQQKESLFSEVFAHTSDYLSVFKVTDKNDFILESFNRSTENLRDYNFAQFFGRSLVTLVESDKRDFILSKFRKAMETKQPQMLEEEIKLPGGGIQYLSTTLVPVMGLQGNVERIASLSRDVSNFKKIEEELRAEKERAEQANRSKTDFLASMSHELRTPLNIVLGMAELLKDSLSDSAEEIKYVKSIERSGRVLLTLIEDVLDLSKIEAGKMKLETVRFELLHLVEEMMEGFRPQADSKSLILNFNMNPKEEVYVFGDPSRIRQVLTNLISNALKFTEVGQVSLDIFLRRTDGRNQSKIEFRVRDTGVGIAQEEHPRIFEKFSQVDSGMNRRYGGTGLGLAISKRLVNMMNGDIGFESARGHGSTFWFVLPLDFEFKTQKPEVVKKEEKPQVVKTPGMSVLVVDDNPDTRQLMSLLLKSMGHQAKAVTSGEEAIQTLTNQTFDLVLMDIQMPGMDGMEATRKIRELDGRLSKLPVIACTANAMAGDRQRYLNAGMSDYLSKPVDKNSLKHLLAKWSLQNEQQS